MKPQEKSTRYRRAGITARAMRRRIRQTGLGMWPPLVQNAQMTRPHDLKTYIINLDRSTDRWPEAARLAKASGLAFERISGVDGLHMTPEDRSMFGKRRSAVLYGWPMLDGHIGCALSHIRVLKRFVATNAPYALILEDDHAALPSLGGLVDRVIDILDKAQPDQWHVVNLGHDYAKRKTEIASVQDVEIDRRLCAAHNFPLRTTACLWSRAGAIKFLRHACVIYAPVDAMLQDFCMRGGGGYLMSPPPVPFRDLLSELEAINDTQRPASKPVGVSHLARHCLTRVATEIRNLRNLFGARRHQRAHKGRHTPE